MSQTTNITKVEGIEIAEVDVLRLKFVSDGKLYNLGVVADTTTSDGKFDSVADDLEIDMSFFNETFEKIISIILLLIGIILLVNVIIPVGIPLIKLLVALVSALIKVVINIVTFPFRVFGRKRK